ncbi:MAG: ammonia-forming cytochrome c nitrite reductase subunit c552 [Lentisphaeraceae bacterium]|nr:ammonia-forming cytochrome c nitrite reductase subunit c552 [Lentisphaeraceae bacterium]
MMTKFKWFIVWLIMTISASTFLGYQMFQAEEKPLFIPNETTHGHYQIEMKCSACHTPNMGVKQDACITCHGQELKDNQDSHPENKFNDPRNFDMIAKLDARKCITCHTEHSPHTTGDMGVTIPIDYCAACHEDIGNERESHKDLKFDSCATAGCHNYHDNRALYEDFLVKHYDQKDHLETAQEVALEVKKEKALTKPDADFIVDPQTHHDWSSTAHAKGGVNCKDCHQPDETLPWSEKVSVTTCQDCHEDEYKGLSEGKHGMRLAADLSPMTPNQARLKMKKAAAHKELNCISCHSDHRFDTKVAAVDACLRCHNDEHSLNYKQSPHFNFWQIDHLTKKSTKGVSCATCHMPRVKKHGKVVVEHNQNATLRPNEKMIRTSCLKCHSLQFSINALADEKLIENNFKGYPTIHVESLEWAKQREKK